MADKLTIQDLAAALAEKNGIDRKDAETFIRAMFDLIEESLEKDKYVKVKGFGVFKLISVNNRESVNINTGERFEIQEHYKVSFIPDPTLKGIINKPFEFFDSVVLNEGTELENTEEEPDPTAPEEDEKDNAPTEEIVSTGETTEGSEEAIVSEEESSEQTEASVEAEAPAAEEVTEETDTTEPTETVEETEVPEPVAVSEQPEEPEAPVESLAFAQPNDAPVSVSETKIDEPAHSDEIADNVGETVAPEEDMTEETYTGGAIDMTAETVDHTENESEPELPQEGEETNSDETPDSDETEETADDASEDELEPVEEGSEESDNAETAKPAEAEVKPVEPQSDSEKAAEKKTKGKGSKVWIVAACLIIGLGIGFYAFYASRGTEKDETATAAQQQSQKAVTVVTETAKVPETTGTDSLPEAKGSETAATSTSSVETPETATAEATPKTVADKEKPESKLGAKKAEASVATVANTASAASTAKHASKGKYTIVGLKCEHKIVSGETLRKVALKYYGTKELSNYIVEYNNIKEPNKVGVGTVLKIPELKANE